MPRSAYPASARQLYRLLNSRRPAEDPLAEHQQAAWNELAAGFADRKRFDQLRVAISDGEGDWAYMREQELLLAVGTICMQNARPDLWRQVYQAWVELPEPGGEVTLLEELVDRAQRDEI